MRLGMKQLAALGLGLVLLGTSSACAQNGNGSGVSGWGVFDYGADGTYQRIPFYALYPPVYYSHIVPRTYGYSPFAYPPGVMTPEVDVPVEAAIIRNPFVPSQDKPSGEESRERTAARGRIYYNPYVQQARAR